MVALTRVRVNGQAVRRHRFWFGITKIRWLGATGQRTESAGQQLHEARWMLFTALVMDGDQPKPNPRKYAPMTWGRHRSSLCLVAKTTARQAATTVTGILNEQPAATTRS